MFNDMLGTTLGVAENGNFTATPKTAFGEPTTSQPHNSTTETDKVGFFTGKPYIGELGYAFLFRNYRADQGKWQTKDPLGYPDGWNNLAYCNNNTMNAIDPLGLKSWWQWTKETLASFSYGAFYIFNVGSNLDPLYRVFFAPLNIPTAITSLYTANVVKNMGSVVEKVDSFYTTSIGGFNKTSQVGAYSLTSKSYSISNNNNTAWGAIVGTSTLTISGTAQVTNNSYGGRDVTISLLCNFNDDIDWKSYEELVVGPGGISDYSPTDYMEGALDVWLDQGLNANYDINVSWNKVFTKRFE